MKAKRLRRLIFSDGNIKDSRDVNLIKFLYIATNEYLKGNKLLIQNSRFNIIDNNNKFIIKTPTSSWECIFD